METLALTVLTIFSLAGFAAIFFTTFGTLIILIGAILYALLTGFSVLTVKTILLLSALYLLGEAFEYIFIIMGAKKFGASNKAVIGAIIGGIAGAILGSALFGIGLIFGAFAGVFAGAFLVELIAKKDVVKSLKAGAGGVVGRVGSIIAKVIIAVFMLYLMFGRIIG
jgi:uncharacterized protein YqgC (DUF456 family)